MNGANIQGITKRSLDNFDERFFINVESRDERKSLFTLKINQNYNSWFDWFFVDVYHNRPLK